MSQPMDSVAGLPQRALEKADPTPDSQFYRAPRMVTHIDDAAIAAVTELYRNTLPPGGTILDLMSSWVSHLPPDIPYAQVIGHGMNEAELAANPQLTQHFVQDLNADPALPLRARSFDGACLCVSVQYLQGPVSVLQEVLRVLRPGAPLVITYSDRYFPTKAVAIWQALGVADRQKLVTLYLTQAGFELIDTGEILAEEGDPLWAVVGHAPQSEAPHDLALED
ncbi:methyltransferase domain-containing protein [Acidisphaera sp. L21]|uniref:class I SAM-dependent methyltransferase n=1 Tax=Acidisphaera sp. L21 TaxID=1641851 RepID=UPI001C2032FF|nr:methyltransferase domain-containing protein [Acidisphaera sp. L21]